MQSWPVPVLRAIFVVAQEKDFNIIKLYNNCKNDNSDK